MNNVQETLMHLQQALPGAMHKPTPSLFPDVPRTSLHRILDADRELGRDGNDVAYRHRMLLRALHVLAGER